MSDERSNTPNSFSKLQQSSQLTNEEIKKIKPFWACGDNKDKLTDPSNYAADGDFAIFFVDLKQLIEKADFMEVNPNVLLGNSELSDKRINKILLNWQKGIYLDPPEIHSFYQFGKLASQVRFSDGRHRTIAAYHLDESQIPVAIYKADKKIIDSIVALLKEAN